jgi:hypothetical protein
LVVVCANLLPIFILKLSNPGIVLNGAPLDGTYNNTDNGDGIILGFNGGPSSSATALSLNAAGNLVMESNYLIASTDLGQTFELLHFDTVVAVSANKNVAAAECFINPSGNDLVCNSGGKGSMQLCPRFAVTNDLFIGDHSQDGCVEAVLNVVPVCTVPGG